MTILKVTALVALISVSLFSQSSGIVGPREHDEWLFKKYNEAVSIKEGMTRAELLKVYGIDGGLQQLLPRRYVLRGSNLIKVDVEFILPAESQGKIVIPEDLRDESKSLQGSSSDQREYLVLPNEKLIIKSISKPYLEQFNYD
jgi:hypothetical protein